MSLFVHQKYFFFASGLSSSRYSHVGSLLTNQIIKGRKRLAYDIMYTTYTAVTHATHIHKATDFVKMATLPCFFAS